MTSFTESTISLRKLSGHKKSVNCMSIDAFHEQLLFSGSDDKTVRIWDLRTNRSQKCIAGCSAAIESLAFSSTNKNMLCVAADKSLYTFDVRFEGVLQRVPTSELHEGFEEINQIVAHPKDGSVAVGDDSGNVTIIPISGSGVLSDNSAFNRHKKLSRLHTNLVGALAYRPSNPGELLSGGFDCMAAVWEVGRGRPQASIKFEHLPVPPEDVVAVPRNQTLNPPFVQALTYVLDGRAALFGLGDGSLRLLSPKDLHDIHSLDVHGGMLTAMSVSAADSSVVLSGGIDKAIHVWSVVDTTVRDPNFVERKPAKGKGKAPQQKVDFTARLEKVWSALHDSKVNALLTDNMTVRRPTSVPAVEGEEAAAPTAPAAPAAVGRVFVADMTADISVYELQ